MYLYYPAPFRPFWSRWSRRPYSYGNFDAGPGWIYWEIVTFCYHFMTFCIFLFESLFFFLRPNPAEHGKSQMALIVVKVVKVAGVVKGLKVARVDKANSTPVANQSAVHKRKGMIYAATVISQSIVVVNPHSRVIPHTWPR
jgi:hypothetical protein